MPNYTNKSMEIVTINLPKAYLRHIEDLIDFDNFEEVFGYEPSRSELIRHATREYIIKTYGLARLLIKFKIEKRKILEKTIYKEERVLAEVRRREKEVKDIPYSTKRRGRSRKEPLGNKFYVKGVNEE
jgi:Arc/MetJ-type ribon-helix-helix transcriptional regulator